MENRSIRTAASHRHPENPLLPRIWQLRQNLTAYDAAYVALAEALDCPLLTFDAGLSRVPGLEVRVVPEGAKEERSPGPNLTGGAGRAVTSVLGPHPGPQPHRRSGSRQTERREPLTPGPGLTERP